MTRNAPAPGEADPLGLHGVVPPTITAFNEDESVNYERTARHARFVVERGADAVFPLGTNGEFGLLTPQERERVVEAVVDEIGGDAPVLAGVGAEGTHETVQHAVHAAEVGADGLVVVTPYYYPIDAQGAIDHYRRVSDAVDVPMYVYHIPSKTGNALSRETVTRLAAIENVAGVKDSSKDVSFLGQVIDENPALTFMAGSDSLLVPGLDLGCSGLVSAVGNAVPELPVELYAAYDRGDEERARELQSRVYDVRDALKRGPYMAGVKTALELRGFETGPLRSPLRKMDPEQEAALERALDDLDVL